MNQQITEEARAKIGSFLKQIREKKGMTKLSIEQKTGLQPSQIIAIERGNKSYTIDTLIKYIAAVDVYIYFSEKGASPGVDDMISKM